MNKLSLRNLMKERKKKGFTLVELIIVIAIIAILVAIAIPKFGSITRNANIKSDVANAKNLHGIAAQLLAEDKGATYADDDAFTAEVIKKVDGGKLPDVKAASGKFVVSLDNENNIHVKVGEKEVYPNTDSSYGTNKTSNR